MRLAAGVLLVLLAGCNAAQVENVTGRVAVLCSEVLPLAQEASVLGPAGAATAAFSLAACGTNKGLARVAADPQGAAWLDQQAAILRGIIARVRLRQ